MLPAIDIDAVSDAARSNFKMLRLRRLARNERTENAGVRF